MQEININEVEALLRGTEIESEIIPMARPALVFMSTAHDFSSGQMHSVDNLDLRACAGLTTDRTGKLVKAQVILTDSHAQGPEFIAAAITLSNLFVDAVDSILDKEDPAGKSFLSQQMKSAHDRVVSELGLEERAPAAFFIQTRHITLAGFC